MENVIIGGLSTPMENYKTICGKTLSRIYKEENKVKVNAMSTLENWTPIKLAIVTIGEDSASKVYVGSKIRECKSMGFEYEHFDLPKIKNRFTEVSVVNTVKKIADDPSFTGMLVQLPIGIDKEYERTHPMLITQITGLVPEEKDVDGFHAFHLGLNVLEKMDKDIMPCTPKGIVKMLNTVGHGDLRGHNVVVIGRSDIVGKPMANALINMGATVTVCNSTTKDLSFYTKNADVLISAVGKANLIKEDMVKAGAIIIDVGINRNEEGKLCGDVDFKEVIKKASLLRFREEWGR